MNPCWLAAAANVSGPICASAPTFGSTVAPKPNHPVTAGSTSHGPMTLLAIRCDSTNTPRSGSPVTPSGWAGCVGYGPTSSFLTSIDGPAAAPDGFTAEPSTVEEHAADNKATDTIAIYASRIRKKLPCPGRITTAARAVFKTIQRDSNKRGEPPELGNSPRLDSSHVWAKGDLNPHVPKDTGT